MIQYCLCYYQLPRYRRRQLLISLITTMMRNGSHFFDNWLWEPRCWALLRSQCCFVAVLVAPYWFTHVHVEVSACFSFTCWSKGPFSITCLFSYTCPCCLYVLKYIPASPAVVCFHRARWCACLFILYLFLLALTLPVRTWSLCIFQLTVSFSAVHLASVSTRAGFICMFPYQLYVLLQTSLPPVCIDSCILYPQQSVCVMYSAIPAALDYLWIWINWSFPVLAYDSWE